MSIWTHLGIEPTDDLRTIKRAYAVKVRECHPEEHPEDFRLLHEAYETALDHARTGSLPVTVTPLAEDAPLPPRANIQRRIAVHDNKELNLSRFKLDHLPGKRRASDLIPPVIDQAATTRFRPDSQAQKQPASSLDFDAIAADDAGTDTAAPAPAPTPAPLLTTANQSPPKEENSPPSNSDISVHTMSHGTLLLFVFLCVLFFFSPPMVVYLIVLGWMTAKDYLRNRPGAQNIMLVLGTVTSFLASCSLVMAFESPLFFLIPCIFLFAMIRYLRHLRRS